MAGNVWEWTTDFFTPCHDDGARLLRPAEPAGDVAEELWPDRRAPHIPRRVIKGGSHLCAPNYCLRYRPAARQSEAVDTSTSTSGSAASYGTKGVPG